MNGQPFKLHLAGLLGTHQLERQAIQEFNFQMEIKFRGKRLELRDIEKSLGTWTAGSVSGANIGEVLQTLLDPFQNSASVRYIFRLPAIPTVELIGAEPPKNARTKLRHHLAGVHR